MWSADHKLMLIRKNDMHIWPRDPDEWTSMQRRFVLTYCALSHHDLRVEYQEFIFSSRPVTHR